MPCRKELEREARIILQTMLKSKHFIKKLPFGEVALYREKMGQMVFVKKLPVKLIEFMHENAWLKQVEGVYNSTKLGRNWVAEFIYFLDLERRPEGENDELNGTSTHHNLRTKPHVEMRQLAMQMIDAEHSPIVKLYNRQRNIAHKYLNEVHLHAGQKLFEYFVMANLQPNITMDWERLKSVKQSHHTGKSGGEFSENAYVARKQLYESLKHVGPEFAAVLVEICVFGNGLEATERAMNWPARSGKLMLTMALDRLATHFGIMPDHPKTNKYLVWVQHSGELGGVSPDGAANL